MRIRGFEKINKYKDVVFPMPVRKTKTSAGYDICVPEDVALLPGRMVMVPTGVKAYMQEDEFLGVHIRSSMAIKKGIRLVNNVGLSTMWALLMRIIIIIPTMKVISCLRW